MKDFLKKTWLLLVAVCALCCSCSKLEIEENGESDSPEKATAAVSVDIAPWYGAAPIMPDRREALDATRAGAGLSPVTLLVVPDGSDAITQKNMLADGGEFHVRLADGTYDLVAVCGLAAGVIGMNLSDEIAVADGTDFASGETRVAVKDGVCVPSTITITAERQMAWLDVTVTGVPENIVKFELFMKEPCDKYTLDRGWKMSSAGQEKYTKIALAKESTGYTGGGIVVPCLDTSGVTYVAEATTTGGTKTTLTYTSTEPLASGIHLTQSLAYGDLMIVEGGINVGDWTDKTDKGTLVVDNGNGTGNGSGGVGNVGGGSGSASFVVGAALPGYDEVTVVSVDGNVVTFVANEPLEKFAAFYKNLPSKNDYPFPSSIPNTRWYIPQETIAADKDMAGEFMALILSSAETRARLGISTDAADVMAYCNASGGVSCYDFANGEIVANLNDAKKLRCFVFGEMTVDQ